VDFWEFLARSEWPVLAGVISAGVLCRFNTKQSVYRTSADAGNADAALTANREDTSSNGYETPTARTAPVQRQSRWHGQP
jgi:hypothetical protein